MAVAAAASRFSSYSPTSLNLPSVSSVYKGLYEIIKKVLKVFFCALLVLHLSSLAPGANAIQWNTLQEAKAHYPATGCPADLSAAIRGPRQCIINGAQLKDCTSLADRRFHYDFSVFTRHHDVDGNDPVSIVRMNTQNPTVCMYTALDRSSRVTRTCFPDLRAGFERTVDVLDSTSLAKAHQGLEPGSSWDAIEVDTKCAYFHEHPTNTDIGSDPVCLLTASGQGGKVSQTCFDPKNPTVVTMKEAEGVELRSPDGSDAPVSVIFKKPRQSGLDPSATKDCKCADPQKKDEL